MNAQPIKYNLIITENSVNRHEWQQKANNYMDDCKNEDKGYYVIQPHRIQGIIMLLAGISDMVDPQYTQGNWDSANSEDNDNN